MKNSALTLVLSAIALSASSAQAYVPNLACTIIDPCLSEAKGDLGVCLAAHFDILGADPRADRISGSATIETDPAVNSAEGNTYPVDLVIGEMDAKGKFEVVGQSDDGDDWLRLLPNSDDTKYSGTLTIAEDFLFLVECVKR